MANLALNGMVHGAALNGKILFDNSQNTIRTDFNLNSIPYSGYVSGYIYTKLDDSGNVIFNGFVYVSNLTKANFDIDIGKVPDGYPQNTILPTATADNTYNFAEDAYERGHYTVVGDWLIYIKNGHFQIHAGYSMANMEVYSVFNNMKSNVKN